MRLASVRHGRSLIAPRGWTVSVWPRIKIDRESSVRAKARTAMCSPNSSPANRSTELTLLMVVAALATNETIALLPSLSPEGDSDSTSAHVKATSSCWRATKCSRNASIFSRDSGCDTLGIDSFLSDCKFFDPFQIDLEPDAGFVWRCYR